jgi:hypothetical protein
MCDTGIVLFDNELHLFEKHTELLNGKYLWYNGGEDAEV